MMHVAGTEVDACAPEHIRRLTMASRPAYEVRLPYPTHSHGVRSHRTEYTRPCAFRSSLRPPSYIRRVTSCGPVGPRTGRRGWTPPPPRSVCRGYPDSASALRQLESF